MKRRLERGNCMLLRKKFFPDKSIYQSNNEIETLRHEERNRMRKRNRDAFNNTKNTLNALSAELLLLCMLT